MQVVVDTNVLLDGGLDPDSPAAQLPDTVGLHSYIVCRWALGEAETVISRQAASNTAKAIGTAAINRYAERLTRLVADDGGTFLPRNKDEMARRSVAACGADALLTRNVRDFPTIQTVTPTELLRQHDFGQWTIEKPWPGHVANGTVAMVCRCWPGDSFGWLIRSQMDSLVGVHPADGSLRVSPTSNVKVTRRLPLPHGRLLAIFRPIRSGRSIDVDFVDLEAEFDLIKSGIATFPQDQTWAPALKYGSGYE